MAADRHQIDMAVITALCLWAVVGSVALVLAGRAMAGAFDEPVTPWIPVLATSIALLASLTAWGCYHSTPQQGDLVRRLWDGLVAMAPVAMVGFATSHNAAPATLAVIASMLICGLAYLAFREAIRSSAIFEQASSDGEHCGLSGLAPEFAVEEADPAAAAGTTCTDVLPCIHEHLERRSLADGSEEIEAVLIARFAAGQRQTAIHLPIHPVLSSSPNVECEPLDGTVVTARVTFADTFGIRVEVKRHEQYDTEATVPVGLMVVAGLRRASAA